MGSATKSLMARLALTQRYKPRTHISPALLEAIDEQMEARELDEYLWETRDLQVPVFPEFLQAIIIQLDSMQITTSFTHIEAAWHRGDQLLASINSAIESHSSQHGSKDAQNLRNSICFESASLYFLQQIRHCISLLITSSSSAVRQNELCKARRALGMQKASHYDLQDSDAWSEDSNLVVYLAHDVRCLVRSADFPPIYLGNPFPEGSTDGDSTSEEELLVDEGTRDMLYLQLMLRCDSFFVHCTGCKYIIGGLQCSFTLWCQKFSSI